MKLYLPLFSLIALSACDGCGSAAEEAVEEPAKSEEASEEAKEDAEDSEELYLIQNRIKMKRQLKKKKLRNLNKIT